MAVKHKCINIKNDTDNVVIKTYLTYLRGHIERYLEKKYIEYALVHS